MNNDEKRTEYAAGLRMLADLLEAHPEIPLPYDGSGDSPGQRLTIFDLSGDDPKATARAFARVMPGPIKKEYLQDSLYLQTSLRGLRLQLGVTRSAVCERRVIGTEEVVIPAEPAQPAVPQRVETRDVVVWDCAPILADQQVAS